MDKKQLVKDYLTFSKKERIGIYCILIFLLLFWFAPSFFSDSKPSTTIIPDSALAHLIDTVYHHERENAYPSETNNYTYEQTKHGGFTKGTLFIFDPNTLTEEGWKQLGLNERTIKTILNYRNKGGKFYNPEDLQKIWGLPTGFYDHVAQHIKITSIAQNKSYSPSYSITSSFEKKERKLSAFDINQADTAAFIALPGIGAKLAARIINFRDKLGGFHSIEQIKEIYGLPDSTYQELKPYFILNKTEIKKININSATKEELKIHPYIRWQLSNVIIEYRNQHGQFKNISELKNIHLIDETLYNKIAPYLIL
jgi:competence protein ComEA